MGAWVLHRLLGRDPVLIAKWISYQVFNTGRQDWRQDIEAGPPYREREGDLQVS